MNSDRYSYENLGVVSEGFDFGEAETGDAVRGAADASAMGRKGKRKRASIAVAACALALCAVGGTFAWLSASGVLANQFGIGIVRPAVDETLTGVVKSNVKLQNQGTTPVYLRAQVDIYWQDDQGNRLWEAPVEGADYEISWQSDSRWVQGSDGLWYWNKPVAPLGETGVLISSVEQTGAVDSEKHLVVDVSTQAIQSTPAEAATQAWGCTVGSDGMLIPPANEGGA